MAHEIRERDNFGEVRAGGKRAWHGLGDEIEEGLSAEEGFKRIGLGWETELAPIYCRLGKDSEEVLEMPDHRAQVRCDTQEVLGLVGKDYKAFNNLDLARWCDALAGADAAVTIETGGSLYNGRRVFACVKLPKVIQAVANDPLAQYIVVSNGHGGYASFSCYPTSVRVVCANTLRWSESDVGRGISFRHTGNWGDKLIQAREALGLAMAESEQFEEQVKLLVRTNLTEAKMREFMRKTWEDCFGRIDVGSLSKSVDKVVREATQKMVDKRDFVVNRWIELLEDERQKIKGIEGTAWAAYNAVSQWHDHERGRFDSVLISGPRVHSNIFGVSQAHKKVSFDNALALVGKLS